MDRERFERVQQAFDTAIELQGDARAAYLARLEDSALRAEVERLIAREEAGGAGAMDRVLGEAARSLLEDSAVPPERLGSYQLIRDLGHGGMGVVWLAERADDEYRVQVAIKLVRGGFASPELERRFRAERQILADLRHPNIAHLLDGGTAPDGTPYLVMEYVAGEPITVHAARRALGLRERIALFRQVCDAVQHAHASLVVHRDIKPSNILVAADGVPKLLDFGIAKPIAPAGQAETTVALRLLTPAYASPEQLRGERITVATDVYALGVLLHELLAGEPPFAGSGALETARRILEEDPRPASRTLAARPPADAGAPPSPLRPRQLAGDLDNIIARALHKEPAQRYGSVTQLADDIDRFLRGDAVLARAPGSVYRLRKFVSRHRRGVLGAAAAALLIVVLSGFYMVTLRRERDVAERQRDLAERERSKAEQVSKFMVNLFQYVDPEASRGATVTAREVMDEALRQLDTALTDQPDVRADMLANIAEVYINIGLREQAGPVIDEVIRVLRERGRAPDVPLAHAYYLRAKRTDEDADWLQALAVADSAGHRELRLIARQAVAQDMARRGEWDAALRIMHENLEDAAAFGEVPDVFAEAETGFARMLIRQQRYADALPYVRDAVERRTRTLGRDEPRTVTSMQLLVIALLALARYDEAEPLAREVTALTLQLRGDGTAAAGYALGMLSPTLRSAGDLAGADSVARVGLALMRRHDPTDSWAHALVLRNLGNALAMRGDLAGAERTLRATSAMFDRLGYARDLTALRTRGELARVLADRGRLAEAESLVRGALAIAETEPVPVPMQVGHHRALLARILLRRGDAAAADSLLRLAAPQLASVLHREHDVFVDLLLAQAQLALARGDAAGAERMAAEALRSYRSIAPRNLGWRGEASLIAGEALVSLGRAAEARDRLLQAFDDLRASRGATHPNTLAAQAALERLATAGR